MHCTYNIFDKNSKLIILHLCELGNRTWFHQNQCVRERERNRDREGKKEKKVGLFIVKIMITIHNVHSIASV